MLQIKMAQRLQTYIIIATICLTFLLERPTIRSPSWDQLETNKTLSVHFAVLIIMTYNSGLIGNKFYSLKYCMFNVHCISCQMLNII